MKCPGEASNLPRLGSANHIMNTPRFDIDPDYLASQGLSATFPERFWKRVFITPSHWLWEGNRREPMNHGNIWRGVRNDRGTWTGLIYAHVASWIMHNGPIPDGKWVLHCCPERHVPWCVNPEHLYLGTAQDNSRDIQQQTEAGYLVRSKEGILRGEQSPSAKLTDAQVDEIWSRYTGKMGQLKQFGIEFGVTQGAIANIVLGATRGRGVHPEFAKRQARIAEEKARPKMTMTGEGNPTSKLTTKQVEEIRSSTQASEANRANLPTSTTPARLTFGILSIIRLVWMAKTPPRRSLQFFLILWGKGKCGGLVLTAQRIIG